MRKLNTLKTIVFFSILIVIIMNTVLATNLTPFFTNIKTTDWFYEGAKYCYDNGLIEGILNQPEIEHVALSRAEFLSIFIRSMNINIGNPVISGEFTDVEKGSWYEKAVYWAYKNGVVKGTSPDKFSPNSGVTREQAATIIIRYFENNNFTCAKTNNNINFNDNSKISEYAKNYVVKSSEFGLFLGDDNKNFNPQNNITQPQGLTLFMRLHKMVVSGEIVAN